MVCGAPLPQQRGSNAEPCTPFTQTFHANARTPLVGSPSLPNQLC